MKHEAQLEQPFQVNLMLKNHAPIQLIDVRSHSEFADAHAQGATSIPLDKIDHEYLKTRLGQDVINSQDIYLICESGDRAKQALDKLSHQGVHNLHLVEGGFSAWRSERLPVIRTSRVWSLERQTQIALGGLLLLMLIKGVMIHPVFYLMIGLMAIGLIVAGITASCSLSALIARMPWNQSGNKSPA